jgi:hypothetical protein
MISEYYSEDGVRRAVIDYDGDKNRITLYEHDDPFRIYKDDWHHISYWQDCCENFVNYWGEFKK